MSRVLLLEDDPGITEVFSSVLRDHGHDVLTAVALPDAPTRSAVDCVVTDLLSLRRYERGRASEWVAAVRARYGGRPLVVFTAHAEAVDDAERIGADALLAKPCDIDEFVETVERVLHERPDARADDPGRREVTPRFTTRHARRAARACPPAGRDPHEACPEVL